MPEISRFFGNIIRMYVELGTPHHHPHLHAYYQNTVGIYRIDQIEMIEGTFQKGAATGGGMDRVASK